MDDITLKKVKEALDAAIKQKKTNEDIVKSIGPAIIDAIKPILKEISSNSKLPKEEVLKAISNIKVNISDIKVPKPNITIPPIVVPKPDTPIVNYTPPEIRVNVPPIDIKALAAKIEMPDEMNIKGWIGFMGYDRGLLDNPLPVQIRDSRGKPVVFGPGGIVFGGGGGGGVAHQVKINNVLSNPVPVQIVSGAGATSGVNILDSSGVGYSGSNPLPVAIIAGAGATTGVQNLNADGTYRDTFPVEGTVAVSGIGDSVAAALVDSAGEQYSGSNPLPVEVSGITGSLGATILNGDGLARDSWQVSEVLSSIGVTLLDGDGLMKETWLISDITNSVKSALIDSSGQQYSGSNPVPVAIIAGAGATTAVQLVDTAGDYRGTLPIEGMIWVSGITGSVDASLIDSGGVGYSGSNPVPIKIISGALTSTISVGPTAADAIDDGNAPVQIGGIARIANPTAVAGNDVVKATFDTIGRQLIRPVQVRGLVQTAYVTEDEIDEVTLLVGVAGEFHDLIYVMCANESTGAINLDFRQTTGGTVQLSVEVPANGTAGVALPVPIPQDHADASWTVKNSAADNSNTVYSVTALFSKEV